MRTRPERGASAALRLALVGVAAATAGIYLRTLGYEFVVFDDDLHVTGNPYVQAGLGWPGVAWAFSTMQSANWHPLTWLSYMLDRELYGSWAGGYHATNVGLHVAAALASWLALARLSGARWCALYAAALFALHPLHVESVAWVSERKDVLSGLFFWLALWAHAGYARERSRWRWAQVMGFGALGLLSKSMLVTLPLLLLLLDYWPLGRLGDASAGGRIAWRRLGGLVAEKLPLFALAAVASWFALVAQRAAGAAVGLAPLPEAVRLANAMQAYVAYAWSALWPVGLAVYYPHAGLGVSLPLGIAAGALVVALTGLAVWAARRFPYLLVGWLWYLGMLVPVIGLVQVGAQSMADRYTYLPLSGLFVAAVWGLAEIAGRLERERALAWLGSAVLAALALVSSAQVAHWKDSVALFERGVQVRRDNWLMHYDLGTVRMQRGELDAAIHHLSEAVRIEPGYAHAHLNLGIVLRARGDLDGAAAHLAEALRFDPRLRDASNLLAEIGAERARRRERAPPAPGPGGH